MFPYFFSLFFLFFLSLVQDADSRFCFDSFGNLLCLFVLKKAKYAKNVQIAMSCLNEEPSFLTSCVLWPNHVTSLRGSSRKLGHFSRTRTSSTNTTVVSVPFSPTHPSPSRCHIRRSVVARQTKGVKGTHGEACSALPPAPRRVRVGF